MRLPPKLASCLGLARIVGTFGGSDALLPGILDEPVDYLAIGPVYSTTTKQTAGIHRYQGVRSLRAQAGPDTVLVAAAGITFATAQEVLDAGASAIAVSAAIFCSPEPAAAFSRWLESASAWRNRAQAIAAAK